jgi:cytochrome c oxidase subunit 2
MKKLLILASLLLLASCNGRYDHGLQNDGSSPSEFVSNGERIYFTGSSASGRPINAVGGNGHMNMHMRMHGNSCISCHGSEREGRRLWPQFWVKAPALTPDALFSGHEQDEAPDGHGDHGSYDRESLSRAITRGIDPAGEPLDSAMPRWQMSQSDLTDLIDYLSQSHSHE